MQKTQDYYTPKTMPTVVLEGGVVLYFCVPRTYFEQRTMLRNYVESPLGPALSPSRVVIHPTVARVWREFWNLKIQIPNSL
jgi:hypothetical protein